MNNLVTIAMDPPWWERGGGKIKRGVDRHYPLMKTPEILATVLQSPAWKPGPSCSVWIWATMNHLRDALWVMEGLGATYVTNVSWVKAETSYLCKKCGHVRAKLLETYSVEAVDCDKCGKPYGKRDEVAIPQAPGTGQRLRGLHEHLLYGRIGMTPVPAPVDRLPSVVFAPRTKRHSEKPQAAYDLIERHDPQGARLEMFARDARPGWASWGDELQHN